MCWVDLDFTAGGLTICRQVIQHGRQVTVAPVKTEAGERTVFLPRAVLVDLARLRKKQQAFYAEIGWAWHDGLPIFQDAEAPTNTGLVSPHAGRIVDPLVVCSRNPHHAAPYGKWSKPLIKRVDDESPVQRPELGIFFVEPRGFEPLTFCLPGASPRISEVSNRRLRLPINATTCADDSPRRPSHTEWLS